MKLSWFFEKINKKRTQIDKIINERGNFKLIPQEKKKRDHETLPTIACRQIGQLRRNG